MKYTIRVTKRFVKDAELCKSRGYDMLLLRDTMQLLAENGTLPGKYHPHKLTGEYAGKWECHIRPDWLLVWEPHDNEMVMLFSRTGSHADLFR